MKKCLLILIFIFMLSGLKVYAHVSKFGINTIINDSHISKDSIAISIKELDSGKTVYSLNDKILMHPASVQKLLTVVPAAEILGENYTFKTELYSRGNNAYLIKLGADPYLSTSDLEIIAKKITPNKIQKMYIDDSIIEKKDWGEGWQWDDDLNRLMPRFNSYNLDKNIIELTISPNEDGRNALIFNPQKAPVVFFNNVTNGKKNDIKITRDNNTSANVLRLDGTINSPKTVYIPNNNLKLYFDKKLTDSLENNNIYIKENYITSKLSPADKKIYTIEHPLSDAIDDILKNSNNMTAETTAKIAAGKYYNKQGTDEDWVRLFDEYCKKNNIDNSRIRITDASGVSKNNLVYADFISDFLIKYKNNKTLERMAAPSEGTLSARMIPIKDNLKAKTGTLSDISSIAGLLTTKNNRKYAFCIMINDPASSESDKKLLENYIIRYVYLHM